MGAPIRMALGMGILRLRSGIHARRRPDHMAWPASVVGLRQMTELRPMRAGHWKRQGAGVGWRHLGENRMIVELGHFALILALMVAAVQAVLPLWGAQARNGALMALAGPAAVAQFLLVAAAFGVLTWAFVVSDFSLAVVTANSHTLKPMIYKI